MGDVASFSKKVEAASSEPREDPNLMEFTRFTHHDPSGDSPDPRSGHRVFSDHNYLYIIGGFKRNPSPHIFKEVISINLFTKKWRRMDLCGDFPSCLASFSIVQRSRYSNQFIVFGGTGAEFGIDISNDVHLLTIDGQKNRVFSQKLDVQGQKIATYGHAMVRSQTKDDTYYVIGGTTGREFFFDVDELSLQAGKWTWRKLHEWTGDEGRYRLEVVHYGNKIYTFGGGTPSHVMEFDNMMVFDLEKNVYQLVSTLPDAEELAAGRPGYPPRRRCHSATLWRDFAIIAGGCSEEMRDVNETGMVNAYQCVWLFDLQTHRWRRNKFDLPRALFFHDAVVSEDGNLIVWGGVVDKLATIRTNETFSAWLSPPPLYFLAERAVLHHPKVASASEELRNSDPVKIYLSIMAG